MAPRLGSLRGLLEAQLLTLNIIIKISARSKAVFDAFIMTKISVLLLKYLLFVSSLSLFLFKG